MAEMLIGVPQNFEPLRNNRFVAEFPTELGIETWKVRTFSAPKASHNVVEIPFMNEFRYVIGKYKWEAIDVEFIATIGPSTTSQVMEWFRLHSETLTGRQGYAAGYLKDIILKSLDPTGVEVDKWTLRECLIVDIDFGQRDMGDDELQIIKVKLQPHSCIHAY
jgi:hypothetical protein